MKNLPDDKIERALETLYLFKQSVMENVMKRRQEFSKPTLNEVLKKAIEKQAIQKEKDR